MRDARPVAAPAGTGAGPTNLTVRRSRSKWLRTQPICVCIAVRASSGQCAQIASYTPRVLQ